MGRRTDRNPRKEAVSADGCGRLRDVFASPEAGTNAAYGRKSRPYTEAKAICDAAKGMAGLTKRPNDTARSF